MPLKCNISLKCIPIVTRHELRLHSSTSIYRYIKKIRRHTYDVTIMQLICAVDGIIAFEVIEYYFELLSTRIFWTRNSARIWIRNEKSIVISWPEVIANGRRTEKKEWETVRRAPWWENAKRPRQDDGICWTKGIDATLYVRGSAGESHYRGYLREFATESCCVSGADAVINNGAINLAAKDAQYPSESLGGDAPIGS